MKIAYFGGYDPVYARDRNTIKGLKRAGVEVIQCQSRKANIFSRLLEIAKKYSAAKKVGVDAIFICAAGQAYVWWARILSIFDPKVIALDFLTSYYHVHILDAKDATPISLSSFYYYWLDRTACLFADVVLVDTAEHAEYFGKVFKIDAGKFRIFPIGSDEDIFYPRKRREISSSAILRIFCVSSYYPLHGMEYIVRAAKLLEGEAIEIILCGDGPEKKRVMDLAAELGISNVKFLAPISAEEVAIQLAESDICLGHLGDTPQARMVLTFKVWDAAAMGRAIIARVSTPMEKAFKHRENIFFCRPADPADLADAIKTLAYDSKLRQKIGDGAREVFLKEGTTIVGGERLKRILDEILHEHGRRK